jgi:hypothetical protein
MDKAPMRVVEWHFSRLSGKLHGIVSISTSCLDAPWCRAQRYAATPDHVCSWCYARASIMFRKGMDARLRDNRTLLYAAYIAPRVWPQRSDGADVVALRFMSHGDISSVREMNNVMRLAHDAPYDHVALWSKNVRAVQGATVARDARLQCVYSSPLLDVVAEVPRGFDRVFTVFTARVPDDVYECRGTCAECMICYTHNSARSIGIIKHR